MKMCDCNQGRLPCTCKTGEPTHWAAPTGETITAGLKAYNLSKGGAPAKASKAYAKPLYTHPDSGEVERLRAQLAERDALFARILGKREGCAASFWFDEINALYASAEPSAPLDPDERAEFESKFPKPIGIVWCDEVQCYVKALGCICPATAIAAHNQLWRCWQARAALERKS